MADVPVQEVAQPIPEVVLQRPNVVAQLNVATAVRTLRAGAVHQAVATLHRQVVVHAVILQAVVAVHPVLPVVVADLLVAEDK